jgi:hypothetical protein
MEGMRAGLRSRLRRALQRVGEQHRSLREIAVELDRDHGRFLDGWGALLGRELSESALAPAHLKGLRERLAAHELREEHLLARALTLKQT